ncbi:MAG: hypothetical protein NVS9B12_03980 [Vulcanimicrobiaceae bacterium]
MTPRVIAAGGAFAGSALAGLLLGVWLAGHTGRQLWVVGGMFAGIFLGGYGALRMLVREIR